LIPKNGKDQRSLQIERIAGLPGIGSLPGIADVCLCCCCTMQLLTSKVMRGKPKANTRRSNIKGQAKPYRGY